MMWYPKAGHLKQRQRILEVSDQLLNLVFIGLELISGRLVALF